MENILVRNCLNGNVQNNSIKIQEEIVIILKNIIRDEGDEKVFYEGRRSGNIFKIDT